MTRLALCLSVPCVLLFLVASCSRTSPDPASERVASADHLVVIEKAENLPLEEPSSEYLRTLGIHVSSDLEESCALQLPTSCMGKPDNTAIGLGGGARGARRDLRRRYGGTGPDSAVDLNLDWLAKHQTQDEGDWDSDGFQAQCMGNLCDDKGNEACDPATTGLAVLSFLGAGYTHQAGRYKKTVSDALKYLNRIQDGEGCIGPRKGPYIYAHAVCTLALAEAYGLTSSPLLRQPTKKAVAFLLDSQLDNPAGAGKLGWGVLPDKGENRLEVTTWATLALRSAREAGLAVPQGALDGIKTWLHSITDPTTGTICSVPARSMGSLPNASTEACTAMGMFMRHLLGEDTEKNTILEKGAAYLLSRLPALQDRNGFLDPVPWYFGTLALFHAGGRQWAAWNQNLKKVVLKVQCKSGCEKGSWDARGAWGAFGGRIFTTALLAMTTQVYYRYGKVAGTRYLGGCPEPEDSGDLPGAGMLKVPGAGPNARFPLEHTHVRAEVSGWLATTRVTQTFGNPFQKAVEAVYVFPLPTSAAVNDFVMEIQGRKIVGVVRPRAEARRMYRAARARGQTASLLTQERPNIFTQSVANIAPGGRVNVHITYFHGLKFENGHHDYVFPMVLGPRYMPGTPAASDGTIRGGGTAADTDQVPDASRISPPVLPPDMRSGHDVSIRVDIHAGVPLLDLKCPTHDITVLNRSACDAAVELAPHDTIPDRDFVLRWTLSGPETRAGLLAHRTPGRGGFFTAFLVPMLDPSDADVSPREVTFVLDTSGSMRGLPLELSKRVVRRTLRGLRPYDRFNLIRFAGDSGMLSPTPLENTPGNLKLGLDFINGLHGNGGTEMLGGIRAYLKQPGDSRYARIVCFLTDGFVGNEAAIHRTIHTRGQSARWYAFGIGSSVNRHLVEGIAEHGNGVAEVVLTRAPKAASAAAEAFLRRLDAPMLTDVTLLTGGLPVTDVYPRKIPDLTAGQPLCLTGRYTAPAEGTLVFRGRVGGRTVVLPFGVKLPEEEKGHAALAPVWARHLIRDLSRQMLTADSPAQENLRRRIVDTAVDHRLVSRYTAFMAVDGARVVGDGRPVQILQPVTLPEGVVYEGAVGSRPGGKARRIVAWGVTLAELPDARLVVAGVDEDGPCARTGVKTGDVLAALDRHALFGARHLEALLLQAGGERLNAGFRPGNGDAAARLRRVWLPRP